MDNKQAVLDILLKHDEQFWLGKTAAGQEWNQATDEIVALYSKEITRLEERSSLTEAELRAACKALKDEVELRCDYGAQLAELQLVHAKLLTDVDMAVHDRDMLKKQLAELRQRVLRVRDGKDSLAALAHEIKEAK